MNSDKQQFINKTIATIKTYFEFDDDMKAYHIFFNNGIKLKMGFDNKNRIMNDIFIQYDNLYFSFIDKTCDKIIVQELCNSQNKNRNKQSVQGSNCKETLGARWWNDYIAFFNNKRFIEQEEIIKELTAKLKLSSEKIDNLVQELTLKSFENEIEKNDKPPKYDSEFGGQCSEVINLDDNITKTEKSVIIVPFDRLMATNEQAHNFLCNYYCCDEYKKYTIANTETNNHVEEFLDTSSKKFLFNMHYINRINKRKFVSVFKYSINDNVYHNKMSAVNKDGLGFITVRTNNVFTYQKYDEAIKYIAFDELFAFEWLCNDSPHYGGDWFCNTTSKMDLFARFSNPLCATVTVCYLRIIQCK
jgi:hypothetical protein